MLLVWRRDHRVCGVETEVWWQNQVWWQKQEWRQNQVWRYHSEAYLPGTTSDTSPYRVITLKSEGGNPAPHPCLKWWERV